MYYPIEGLDEESKVWKRPTEGSAGGVFERAKGCKPESQWSETQQGLVKTRRNGCKANGFGESQKRRTSRTRRAASRKKEDAEMRLAEKPNWERNAVETTRSYRSRSQPAAIKLWIHVELSLSYGCSGPPSKALISHHRGDTNLGLDVSLWYRSPLNSDPITNACHGVL